MNYEAHAQRLLARYESLRWLRPDAAMDALTEEARAFLEERTDEFRAAMSALAEKNASVLPTGLLVTRSLVEAQARSNHAKEARDLRPFSAEAERWSLLLEAAHQHAEARALTVFSPEQCAELATRVWTLLRGNAKRATERDMLSNGTIQPVSASGAALVSHAWWSAVQDREPSPWEPLLALWERGLCLFATPDAELLAYVPVWDQGKLRVAPDGRFAEASDLFQGEVHSPSLGWGSFPPEPSGNGLTVLRRFNRSGLGPLPRLVQLREPFFGIANAPDRFDRYYHPLRFDPVKPTELQGAGPLPDDEPVPWYQRPTK